MVTDSVGRGPALDGAPIRWGAVGMSWSLYGAGAAVCVSVAARAPVGPSLPQNSSKRPTR